jgi:hypothetical protein
MALPEEALEFLNLPLYPHLSTFLSKQYIDNNALTIHFLVLPISIIVLPHQKILFLKLKTFA